MKLKNSSSSIGAALLVAGLVNHSPAGTTDAGPPTPPASNESWEVTGAAGLSVADGNAQSVSYGMQVLGSRLTAEDEIYLGADYFYSKDGGVATTDSLQMNGQYNRFVAEHFYYGGKAGFLTDDVADIGYRFSLDALLGYYLLKRERASLAFEAGPGYTWEKQSGLASGYANLRLAEKFEYKFGTRSKLWQSLAFSPEIGDFENHTITAEAGIDTLITDRWSLRIFVRHQLDNTPAAGREKGDTTAIVGLAYALGGIPKPAETTRRTLKPDTPAKAAAAPGWTTTAALGFSSATGNSDTSSITAGFDTAHRSPRNEFFFNAASASTENDGTKSVDTIRADVRYNWLLPASRWFLGANTGYLRDSIAEVDYRLTPGLVAGCYFVKRDDLTLSLEAGPGYTLEEVGGKDDNFASLQAAERLVWTISPRCTLNQSTVFNGEAADPENFTVTSSAALDTHITGNIAFRVAAVYHYDNRPAFNRQHHDTSLTSGIAVKF